MTDFWTKLVEFASTTTHDIGKQILSDFGNAPAIEKSDGTLVTQADKWADKQICDAIATTFPEHGILSEEANKVFPDTDWCWVIDPIDGTTNFTRGIPIWSISLGLLYQGVPVFGYVHLPPLNHSFSGFWSGNSGLPTPDGAFHNGQPIHTSEDNPSSNHFFNLCSRSTGLIKPDFPFKIRMLGVASYNFLTVAMGAVLGGVEATPKVWDIAGVWPIIQAAGGCWISLKSEPFPLQPGVDYSQISYPTLILSRKELQSVVQPFLDDWKI